MLGSNRVLYYCYLMLRVLSIQICPMENFEHALSCARVTGTQSIKTCLFGALSFAQALLLRLSVLQTVKHKLSHSYSLTPSNHFTQSNVVLGTGALLFVFFSL